ncbi:carboxypeptidase-like regulatory domain-containing protein, partial [Streptococcus alactolyticus]|uniref:carboxypeptidase-like regulatory domain-containing protein n=1 Tax=Streptococcus alactolyticus TaxID=29389 RepID=UPI00195BCB3B
VKGTVVDDSTNTPLPLANIFIANSTIGTVANSDGTYKINTVPYGTHQVIASIVGHVPKIVTIDMLDTTEKVILFRLKSQTVQI